LGAGGKGENEGGEGGHHPLFKKGAKRLPGQEEKLRRPVPRGKREERCTGGKAVAARKRSWWQLDIRKTTQRREKGENVIAQKRGRGKPPRRRPPGRRVISVCNPKKAWPFEKKPFDKKKRKGRGGDPAVVGGEIKKKKHPSAKASLRNPKKKRSGPHEKPAKTQK